MAQTTEIDVVVIGAGIAGLAAALECERRGREVLLVDAGDAPGGVMGTAEVDGYRVERGPNTFLRKPVLDAFLRESGIDCQLVRASPEGRKRFVVQDGALTQVPLGPLGFVGTPLLSTRGKLRLLREPFIKRGTGSDESVAEFAARRLGPEIATRLVGPALTGIYAGDERQLGAEAVFPALVELEREHGSLLRGALVLAARSLGSGRSRPTRGSYSHSSGMGGFAAALVAALRGAPKLRCQARMLVRTDAGMRVGLREIGEAAAGGSADTEREVVARAVIIATPARAAADLIAGLDQEAAAVLRAIEYAPIAALGLGARDGSLRRAPEGFGFLVPRDERRALLGCLYMSELFPGRAPAGHSLLHCMLGGVANPEIVDLDDAALRERACADLDDLLGLAAEPQAVCISRWPRAVAQPGVGHRARIRGARQALSLVAPVALAGGYADGVSVADSFASGIGAAASLAP